MQTILNVAEQLGAKLRRSSNEYVGACLRCGGRDRFSLNIKKNVWHCRGCGTGGDAIALARHVLDLSFPEACKFVGAEEKLTLVLDDFLPPPRLTLPPAPAAPAEPEPVPKWTRDLVAETIAGMKPVADSPGETYLRDVRKIDTAAIRDVLERTDAIGWHPSVYFSDPGHELHGKRRGAIVAVMTDAVTGAPTGAISRTYIHAGAKVGKAKTLSSPAGVVRLTPDEDVLEGMHIAEGLETSLCAMAMGFRPMWSTGSTVQMASLPPLDGVESLTILADHDANGAGEKAAQAAATNWLAAGKETKILMPPMIGDFNDFALAA